MAARNQTPALMRMAHPLAFAEFLRELGAPVDRSFRAAGLPVLCDRGDALAPMTSVYTLFDDLARRVDRDLGWQVGRWAGEKTMHVDLKTQIASARSRLRSQLAGRLLRARAGDPHAALVDL